MSEQEQKIEYLSEEEIQQFSNAVKFTRDYYVVFDQETGNIRSLKSKEPTSGTFFKVDKTEIDEFLSGKKNFRNFFVTLGEENTLQIVPKNPLLRVDNTYFITINNKDKNAACVLVHGNDGWSVELDDNTTNKMKHAVFDNKINFYISLKGSPDFLVDVKTFRIADLLSPTKVILPFNEELEKDLSKLDIRTVRLFDSYGVIEHE